MVLISIIYVIIFKATYPWLLFVVLCCMQGYLTFSFGSCTVCAVYFTNTEYAEHATQTAIKKYPRNLFMFVFTPLCIVTLVIFELSYYNCSLPSICAFHVPSRSLHHLHPWDQVISKFLTCSALVCDVVLHGVNAIEAAHFM